MRKIFLILISSCLLLLCCACGSNQTEEADNTPAAAVSEWSELPQKGEFLYEAMKSEHMHNIQTDMPFAADIHINNGWDGRTVHITDSETIRQFVDAFTDVTIGDETMETATDSSTGLTFIFSDGQESSLNFNQRNLEIGIKNAVHIYKLDNFDNLWKLIRRASAE